MTGVVYTLSILLRFDAIQHRIAAFISEEIKNTYEIPINIGAVRISRLNELEIKEILIHDQQGDTIICADRATAHISPLRIFNKELQINTLTVAEPKARIYKASKDSLTNIQFILDKFAKDDKKEKTDFGIKINQLLMYDGKFRYDITDVPLSKEEKLDPAHISIEDIRCNISLKELRNNNINLRIRSIRGREKSGLELQTIKAQINAEEGRICLKDLDILLPNSDITSDSITIAYNKDDINSLEVNGEINCNQFSLKDIKPLLNTENILSIPTFTFKVRGNSNSEQAQVNIDLETLDNNIKLCTDAVIASPYSTDRRASIHLSQCYIDKGVANILHPFISEKILGTINILDYCSIQGDAEISKDRLSGNIAANTECGSLLAKLRIDNNGRYTAKIEGGNINLEKIIDIQEQFTCNVSTRLTGNINNIKNTIFNGYISDLAFRNHEFTPISFNGCIEKEQAFAEINIDDPILKAAARMDYNINKQEKFGFLSLKVDSILPGKIGLRENPEEIFSFDINSDLAFYEEKRHLFNAKIQKFVFKNNNDTYTLNNLHYCDNNTGDERLLMINSDLLDCSVIGDFSLQGVIQGMQKIATKHLEALNIPVNNKNNITKPCNYVYKCDIKQTGLLNGIFNIPVSINEQSTIYGVCNDEKGIFTLNTRMNNLKFKKNNFKTINIDSYSNNDKLVLNANIVKEPKKKSKSKVKKNDLNLNIECTIAQNCIDNTISWNNNSKTNRQNGKIRFNTELGRNENKLLTIKSRVQQDSIVHNDSTWYISGGSINGNQEELHIKSMYLYNNDQYLKIDGTAGKSQNDSLYIKAKNLDVAAILNLVNFKILEFGGNATGQGYITNLLAGPDVKGTFDVDSLQIDNCHMGNGFLNIGWENKSKSILLDCDINNGNDIISNVNGFLSQAQDTIHLAIDANELNAGFVNKMLKSFMSDIKGVGNGKAYVLGSWRKVNLVGAVKLNCSARIKPTNVTYFINGDTLYFHKNLIAINNIHAKDRRGNSGWLNGKVTHNNMANWVCDINVRAENLLAYDTNNFDSSPFYGTVYATGNANITANGNGIFLKAEAKSEPNTRFVYNASQSGSVRDNSFVKFIDSSKKDFNINISDEEIEKNQKDNINSRLNLDFMLDITEDAQIKVYTNLKSDDYLEIYGKGSINAIYDEKEGFSMKGNVDLDRGTYKITVQDIFTKEFSINKGGTLSFNGDPTEVGLNIRAKYLVPSASLNDLTTETSKRKSVKVNCLMDITGTLKSPNLSFDIELPDGNEEERELLASAATTPEQKNMQFIYLLGIGKFYTYDYNNMGTGDSQTSTAVESLISNTLSGQLNNMLGQIINNGNWNISGNFSTNERGWNSMEIEGMLEGRLLNNRLLINSNFGYRENPIANSNFIGDFELQWLLNKTGTVSLKAYSKTNDRYFSKTNLTTQGAGIIFRHDFNKWFWWRSKKKKKEKTEKQD